MFKKFLFVSLYTLFSLCSLHAQILPTNEDLRAIRLEIQRLVADSIIPSMAISVVKDGEILWQEAIGFADVELQKEATVHSIYPIGSVSKSITATGIMHLVNVQLLDLQDNINPIIYPIELKDINGHAPQIKLWQLLSMNAGINHGYGVFHDRSYLPLSKIAQKKFFEETTIVAFPPGTTYEYSNRSFYLAELLIERISGKHFQEFLNAHLFYPLGMKNTIAYAYQNEGNINFVTTYAAEGLEKIEKAISYPSGGSGLWSSIADMTNYALFHLGEKPDSQIVNDKNLNLMHEFRQGPADLFGIGWFNFNDKLYSNGNVSGGNAAISIDKKNKLGIISLLNKTSWDGLADQYVGKIEQIFNPEKTDGYKTWKRIYGTPYSDRFELLGKWKGMLKKPNSKLVVPIEIKFNQNNNLLIIVDQEEVTIRNPTFNLFGELQGRFTATLPGITVDNMDCSFKLKYSDDQLSGYLMYDDFKDYRYYKLPLYMQLEKVRE